MTISSISRVIQATLTSHEVSNTFWATHHQSGLFSIFGQNVKVDDQKQACPEVRFWKQCTGRKHWLSMETLDMILGMFLTAIKAITIKKIIYQSFLSQFILEINIVFILRLQIQCTRDGSRIKQKLTQCTAQMCGVLPMQEEVTFFCLTLIYITATGQSETA